MALINFNFTKNISLTTNSKPSSSPTQFDKSTLTLLISNLITIIVAVIQKWNLTEVMWVYWLQSVIIGIFYFKKILNAKDNKTNDLGIDNQSIKKSKNTNIMFAYSFLVQYNIFHFGYLIFLLTKGKPENLLIFTLLGVSFFLNHLFSYLDNKENDSKAIYNIGTLMILPYRRILPMHLIICLGGFITVDNLKNLILFMVFKTFADIKMHQLEHQNYQIKEELNDSKQ